MATETKSSERASDFETELRAFFNKTGLACDNPEANRNQICGGGGGTGGGRGHPVGAAASEASW